MVYIRKLINHNTLEADPRGQFMVSEEAVTKAGDERCQHTETCARVEIASLSSPSSQPNSLAAMGHSPLVLLSPTALLSLLWMVPVNAKKRGHH